MSKKHGGGNRQREFFARSQRPVMQIEESHRLVLLCDQLDWTELEEQAEAIRKKKLKNGAGRPPQLRALMGATVLMATRKMSYREAEDQIRHYAPARYLCGLTESEWTPDFTTIQDFAERMGPEGMSLFNQVVVKFAAQEKFCDPRVVSADTTAQEAAMGWPNEMGLMARFMKSVATLGHRAGQGVRDVVRKLGRTLGRAKEKVRRYRLFAKTKAARLKLLKEMATLVKRVQRPLSRTLAEGPSRLRGYGKYAQAKVHHLHATMKCLLPQIEHWLRTGHVASGKIINLHIPELYAIVRGKVGKAVEFGLSWGMARLKGGYLLATMATHRKELVDAKFAVRAVDDHIALFGRAPRAYAYDRAAYSKDNISSLRRKGVHHVGLAPRGQAPWQVSERVRTWLIKERAKIEGSIGALKSSRYGFHRPAARSVAMMGACGHRAVLGLNLNKLARDIARRHEMALTG